MGCLLLVADLNGVSLLQLGGTLVFGCDGCDDGFFCVARVLAVTHLCGAHVVSLGTPVATSLAPWLGWCSLPRCITSAPTARL